MEPERKYIIVLNSELNLVDFSEVIQNENELLKKNIDKTKVVLKWEYDGEPSFLQNLSSYEGPFNHEQIIDVLMNSEWIFE